MMWCARERVVRLVVSVDLVGVVWMIGRNLWLHTSSLRFVRQVNGRPVLLRVQPFCSPAQGGGIDHRNLKPKLSK